MNLIWIFIFYFYVSPFVKGLSKYDDAVQRGANGDDCALYYDDCPYALDKLPKFFQQH